MNEHDFGFETQAIRGQLERTQYLEHSVPLYLTSSFVFEDAEDMRASFAEEKERNIYSRYSNPNTIEFINKVCQMEGAETGFAFASGMAAVYSTFAALLKAGDHIVSASSVFGATHSLFVNYFPKWNIETTYFDLSQPETIESCIQPNTKILFAESPTNPAVDIIDLELLGKIAKKHNLILIIDNCFATPYLQQPIKWGADLVVVGYGQQKKITLTGSVSSVSGREIRENPSASLQNALAGKLPGFFSQQPSGRPGADGANFYIRGVSSYNGNNRPLIIVDDVEYSYDQFARIDPNEIENLSILKDASTTAIYGVRGANGVIVVSTRRGKEGPANLYACRNGPFATNTYSSIFRFLRNS